jgi:hypothetical protein
LDGWYVLGMVTGLSPLWLSYCLLAIRWWISRPASKCPRCKAAPPAMDVVNRCWQCGCEYDKWGNLLKEAATPQLDDLDLARFCAKRNPAGPDNDRYQRSGLTQESMP